MTLQQLNDYFCIMDKLRNASEMLESMKAKILSANCPDGMPHSHTMFDRTQALAFALASQEKAVAEIKAIAAGKEAEIKEYIQGISDPYMKTLFDLRFMCAYSWKEVAYMIGGGNTSDSVRMACYRYLKRNG